MSRNSVLADMASQDVTAAEFNLLDGVQLLATDAIIGEDAQTKIDFETANEIHFDTNNSEAMVIDTNGNVGIGNANPGDFDGANAQRLVVGDGTGHDGMTIFSSSTDSGTIAFGDSASGAAAYAGRISYAHNTNALSFHTGGNTHAMTINSSQKVGIGTTAPVGLYPLEIRGNTTGAASTGSGTSGDGSLRLSNTGGTQVMDFGMSNGGYSWIQSTQSDSLGANWPICLQPNNGGKVGIGTTAPVRKFDIIDTATEAASMTLRSTVAPASGQTKGGGSLFLELNQANNTGSGGSGNYAGDTIGQIIFQGQGSDYVYNAGSVSVVVDAGITGGNRSAQATHMKFNTIPAGSVSSLERMRITSAGALTLTTAKLSVSLSGSDTLILGT